MQWMILIKVYFKIIPLILFGKHFIKEWFNMQINFKFFSN